jgi:hypothetical protein
MSTTTAMRRFNCCTYRQYRPKRCGGGTLTRVLGGHKVFYPNANAGRHHYQCRATEDGFFTGRQLGCPGTPDESPSRLFRSIGPARAKCWPSFPLSHEVGDVAFRGLQVCTSSGLFSREFFIRNTGNTGWLWEMVTRFHYGQFPTATLFLRGIGAG